MNAAPVWRFLLASALFVLGGCTATEQPPAQPQSAAPDQVIERFRSLAEQGPEEAARFLLDAASQAHEEGDSLRALRLLNRFPQNSGLPSGLLARHGLLEAELALATNRPRQALGALRAPALEESTAPNGESRRRFLELRSGAHYQQEQYLAAARDRILLMPLLSGDEQAGNINGIWEILSSAPAGRLSSRDELVDSYELRGWLELLRMTQASENNIEQQIAAIERWRNRWGQHSAAQRLPDSLAALVTLWENRPQRIDLLLPLQGPAGNAVHQGFMSAYYDALEQGQPVPEIRVHDTSGASNIWPIYRGAAEQGSDLIIGPLNKAAVRQLQGRQSLPVITLALNYGEQPVSPEGLYQFGLAPEHEISQLANLAWQNGHRNAAVMTPAGTDYQRIQESFVSGWQELGGETVARASFTGSQDYSGIIRTLMHIDASETRAERVRELLPRDSLEFTPRRRQDVGFLFLSADPAQGRRIKPTLAFHYAGDVPVYAMPSIHDGGNDPVANRDLDGLIFVDAPWLLNEAPELKQRMADAWPRASGAVQRLRAMGVDSFRLYTRVQQMAEYPETRMQGATGVLYMRPDGRIARELIEARFTTEGDTRIMEQGEP